MALGFATRIQRANVAVLNWTATTISRWQADCETFRRTGKPFELRDVTTSEHRQFVLEFAARYGLSVFHGDGIARFEAQNQVKSAARRFRG